jgi:GNAT superfamily N-acetyltransferase
MDGVPAEVRELIDVDDDLRTALLRCWTDVVNSGGAVGFVPPVTTEDIAPWLDAALVGIRDGVDRLALLVVDGEPAGFAMIVRSDSPLRRHWASVYRVQVHPSKQGQGLGRVLMDGVLAIARRCGYEFLYLNVRGGTGIDGFYAGLGYTEVGRVPRALLLEPGDYRDEIVMVRPL